MSGISISAVLGLLQSPATAAADSVTPLLRAPNRYTADLVLIAAAIYARPDLLRADLPSRIAALFAEAELPVRTAGLAREVLEFLLATSLGPAVVESILALAARPGLSEPAYQHLCAVLEYAGWWAVPLLDAQAVVALAEAAHLLPYRELLCERVIQAAVHAAGASLDASTLARACRLFGEHPSLRYLLYRIARWQQFTPAVREAAAAATPAFPFHEVAAERLSGEGRRVLIVHNIQDGQGDEMVRGIPLVQALVDFNPLLEVSIVSRRAYLTAHPRVVTTPIGDRAAVDGLLRREFDVVLEFFEPKFPSMNHDVELKSRLQEYVRTHKPFFFATSLKGSNQLTFQGAWLNGIAIAQSRGLDAPRSSVYDPGARLIAELGLPMRSGEDPPVSEFVLAGLEWPEARTAWNVLVQPNTERRPVAIFQPFGGHQNLKGFVEQTLDAAVAEMMRLAGEGYFIVLLPNGTPWGSARHATELAERLPPECRRLVAIAEDPGRQVEENRLHENIPGAPPLGHADYVMRQFLYFTRYAGLIVTIEGWLVHVAWCLGKPFRVLLAPYSQCEHWSPRARTIRQTIAHLPSVPAAALDAAAPPPLVELPRQFLLMFLLRELGKSAEPEAVPLLRKLLASPDRHLRRAAAEALAGLPRLDSASDFLPLLEDSWHGVRGVAAQALLQHANGVPVPQAVLLGYVFIGLHRDWSAVLRLGNDALPALQAALADEDEVIRREALDTREKLDGLIQIPRSEIANPSLAAGIAEVARLLLTPRRDFVPEPPTRAGTVLILTPVKDAAAVLDRYCEGVRSLTYPHDAISFGFLESDSRDATFRTVSRHVRRLRKEFRRAAVWKKDFGYQLPRGVHRSLPEIQAQRRVVLARSRNHLLFHALDDEEWVLWLDADVMEYPPDVIERLLATGKDLVHPNCVLDYGGASFDQNAWCDHGRLHLDDLRAAGDLVEIDSVGGSMLLVRADLHRDGLVFPAFPYGRRNPRIRPDRAGEVETEGLAMMARDMGHRCWGMPNLEILHGKS